MAVHFSTRQHGQQQLRDGDLREYAFVQLKHLDGCRADCELLPRLEHCQEFLPIAKQHNIPAALNLTPTSGQQPSARRQPESLEHDEK